eukprot:CAMPEP_0203965116 /NCGR_PEP_ID=MMETSP0359-20131031/94689_1 /ASSEMBLY_ACC=CAM_ASM_000338 /TAXON_ID=268821 /ORGANISM="Scrippsiella Hangoei, Strain SHTV-5" /LENGTH=233 /DNA_ID=CAMNT_0050901861 /DNA_START=76 /DNA_END=777 /DNA_ORIENTATION=+
MPAAVEENCKDEDAEDYEYSAVISRDSNSNEALVARQEPEKVSLVAKPKQREEVRRWLWRRVCISAVFASAILAAVLGAASLGPRLLSPDAPLALPSARVPAAASVPSSGAASAPASSGEPLMTAHDVANTLSEYAQLGRLPDEQKLASIQRSAQKVVGQMTANDVARTLDAYAQLGHRPGDALLTSLGERAQQVVGDMDAQDVTNTINAYAEFGQGLPESGFAGDQGVVVSP